MRKGGRRGKKRRGRDGNKKNDMCARRKISNVWGVEPGCGSISCSCVCCVTVHGNCYLFINNVSIPYMVCV